MPHDLGTALKIIALVLSLSLDTLAVSVALGIGGIGGRARLRAGISFALFEGGMPLIGLLLGRVLSGAIGDLASDAGIAVLFGVGGWMVYGFLSGAEEGEISVEQWHRLLLTGLSVSLDEFAIGFSIGALGVPIALTIALIAAQAFGMTFVGSLLGNRIGERLAERGELVAGLVLCGLAIVLAGARIVH